MMVEEKNNPINVLNAIKPEINEARDLVTFEGKVYDLKDGKDKKDVCLLLLTLIIVKTLQSEYM